jgi:hypothetical protein
MRSALSSILATVLVAASMAQAITLMVMAPWSGPPDVAWHLLIEGPAILSGPLVLMLAWRVRPRSPASMAAALLAASVWLSSVVTFLFALADVAVSELLATDPSESTA